MSEEEIQYLEEQIPELAKEAVRQPYLQALASGSSVLIAEDGEIREVFPDGTKRTVEKIAPFVEMQKGRIIQIK